MLGYELRGLLYSLTTPSTIAITVVSAVLIAPLTEEISTWTCPRHIFMFEISVVTAIVGMTLLFPTKSAVRRQLVVTETVTRRPTSLTPTGRRVGPALGTTP